VDGDIVCIPLPSGSLTGPKGPPRDPLCVGITTHFVVGPENRLVEAAIQTVRDEVASGLGAREFNPLVFYGPTSTGKSHLALGLAAVFRERWGPASVVLIDAVDFARRLTDAMEAQSIETFRQRFAEARLVVVEDVTRLAERTAAQRELLYVVDEAVSAGHRIVVTASLAPGQWPQILPGLQSRLAAGLSVPVALPGREAREVILRQLARQRGMVLADAGVEVLANAPGVSVRELAGALAALAAESQTAGATVDAVAARRWLGRADRGPSIGLTEIAMATARSFGLTVGQLRSRTRRREVVTARDVAMYLARELTRENLKRIGEYFGGRDHTTVLHGCRKAKTLLETEPAVHEAVTQLEYRLKAS